MALLNGLYVHAKSETIENPYTKTNNPVEEGVDITDHIERNLIKLKLEGELIDTPTLKAGKMYSQLQIWANKGTIIEFRGRNVFDGVITNISKTSTCEISNGAEVTIDFEEIRIANSPYKAPSENSGTQQVQTTKNTGKEVYHIVQKGEWLLKIARKYNVTLKWILENNKLKSGNPNLIYPGEKILVSRDGVPNTATASTKKTTATTTTKKADTTNVTKQVAKMETMVEDVKKEQSYVITDLKKKANLPDTVIYKDGTIKQVTPIPAVFKNSINDKISRMKVYVSYFEKTPLKQVYTAENEGEYKKYIGWVKHSLSVIEKNVQKDKYAVDKNGRNVPYYLNNACINALDKLDKAKVQLEKAGNISGRGNRIVTYIKTANTLLDKWMNYTQY